jgi:hypothetical protein
VRAQAGGARYHRAAWDRVGETTMAAPERVDERVEAFERHREQLKRSAFGETEVRVQFINPLFEALGWDVRNERGKRFIEQLPIRTIAFANPPDVVRHDQMVALVERMLALHEQLQAARVPQERRCWSGRSRRRTRRSTGWSTSCTG